jgi:uncharacterized protein DUF4325
MKMASVLVDVADFSKTPGGRFRREGVWSGEEFRETVLQPILDRGDDVIVDLDTALGFTSSFLEEVFGGLVRKYGASIIRRVKLKADARPARADRAMALMQRAVTSK